MEDIFLEKSPLGTLYIKDVLLHYIYPRCFVCRNEEKEEYMFYEVESYDLTDVWAVCNISESDLESIKSKKSSIQEIYRKHECMRLIYDYEIQSTYLETSNEVLNKLPKIEVYYEIQ